LQAQTAKARQLLEGGGTCSSDIRIVNKPMLLGKGSPTKEELKKQLAYLQALSAGDDNQGQKAFVKIAHIFQNLYTIVIL
jgi:hypothetical protein